MTQWYVQLTCNDTTLLDFLTTCLQDPFCTVLKEDDKYFWLSSDFDSFSADWEARQYARSQLPLLNSVLHLKFHKYINWLQVDDVYHRDDKGNLIRDHAFADAIGHTQPDESALQKANADHPNISETLLMSRSSALIEEALRHFATPHNWYSLYKVYEIIKKDTETREYNGKLASDTFNSWAQGKVIGSKRVSPYDFEQSAHSYHWSKYGARHSSKGSFAPTPTRPVNPLSLEEGIEYITYLFMRWLQSNP